MKAGDKVRVIQLCSIGATREDCKKYLGQEGSIIEQDDTFAEGQSLVKLRNGSEIWFFNAELCII